MRVERKHECGLRLGLAGRDVYLHVYRRFNAESRGLGPVGRPVPLAVQRRLGVEPRVAEAIEIDEVEVGVDDTHFSLVARIRAAPRVRSKDMAKAASGRVVRTGCGSRQGAGSRHAHHFARDARPSFSDLDGAGRVGCDEPRPGLFGRLCGAGDRRRACRSRADVHDRARQRGGGRGDRGADGADRRADDGVDRREPGPVLAAYDERQPVALDRAGQGRDAPRDRRGGQCGLGFAGQGGRQAGVAAGGRDEPRSSSLRSSTSAI